jgi:DNA-binding beta-propeller fold protein YncE
VLRALTVVGAAAVLASAAAAGPSGGTPAVFASAEGSSQLVGVNLDTGRVIARIRVPTGPLNVTSYSARYVLATSPPAGTVTLVDSVTQRILKIWRGFGSPHDVAVESGYAYVTDEARGQLGVIDLASRRIVARVGVGSRPHNVAVGDVALVTHSPAHPALTVVELRRPDAPRVAGRLAVPAERGAQDITEQADTANAYITGWGSGGVGAIDWGTGVVLWWRKVGQLIQQVQFDYYHGRRLWATDRRTGEVLGLASRNGRVVRRLHGCRGARHVAVVGTAWLVVACADTAALAVWRQTTWQRRPIKIGDRPHDVAEVVLP